MWNRLNSNCLRQSRVSTALDTVPHRLHSHDTEIIIDMCRMTVGDVWIPSLSVVTLLRESCHALFSHEAPRLARQRDT